MATARKHLISLEATPYYHCTSRCVRRAFLCGVDHYSGRSYEHRRAWVEERILFLGQVFAINVCAYAVMSNHHHVVLHVDTAKAQQWSDLQVCAQWHRLYKGNLLSQRFARGEQLDNVEREVVQHRIDQWRRQLCDISSFMKALNEPIARRANAEDECTGRFWESRFKSQALLDEKALLACMAYVDLNPVRAKMAKTPESSTYTAIKKRIEAGTDDTSPQPAALAPFTGNPRESMPKGLPFHLSEYLSLVEMTGRVIAQGKRGVIEVAQGPLLARLEISPRQWQILSTEFEASFKSFVGTKVQMSKVTSMFAFRRRPGITNCDRLLG